MGDWPNIEGFDTSFEQTTPVELAVKGSIPAYAAGVLYRTGPLGYKINTKKGTTFAASHWFDGFSAVHRFQIDNPKDGPMRVNYRSRRVCDEVLCEIKETGSVRGVSFGRGRDPCKSFFSKLMTVFEPTPPNIGVTVSVNMPGVAIPATNGHTNGIKTLHTKTDASILQQIDPKTLEPVGIAMQTSLHPSLKGPLSSAHAKTDPETGNFYNYNLDLARESTYRIFCSSASTGKTCVIAKFIGSPAYIHSFFLTKSYVVLCVWNSHFAGWGLPLLWKKNIIDAIAPFDPKHKAQWYVVDRHHGKGLIATYESDPFFCFHTVNAWEEPSAEDSSKLDIIADLVAYDNLDVLHRYYYDNLVSPGPFAANTEKRKESIPSLTRFRLPDLASKASSTSAPKAAEVVFIGDRSISPELPTINPAYFTKPHRYTYGICDRQKSSFTDGIVKFDNKTQTPTVWEAEAHTPGEAIFIANPEGTEEDDGILLSVILDGRKGKSYLLCLESKTMKEMGRAEVDGPVAFGFHGAHVPIAGKYSGDT